MLGVVQCLVHTEMLHILRKQRQHPRATLTSPHCAEPLSQTQRSSQPQVGMFTAAPQPPALCWMKDQSPLNARYLGQQG